MEIRAGGELKGEESRNEGRKRRVWAGETGLTEHSSEVGSRKAILLL